MRASDKAWLTLAAGVVVYEIAADDGEMLSHAVDRWLVTHPVVTWTGVLVTAAHLLNLLPPQYDPFAWGFQWRSRVRENLDD